MQLPSNLTWVALINGLWNRYDYNWADGKCFVELSGRPDFVTGSFVIFRHSEFRLQPLSAPFAQ